MGDSATRVILIRHAESRPTGDLPESEWPLSERGGNTIDVGFDFERWREMKNPDAFVVSWRSAAPTFARLELDLA